jgi:hypothetical protein
MFSSSRNLLWYWHRFRAMNAAEMAGHFRRKLHQFSDCVSSRNRFQSVREVGPGAAFPLLPSRSAAPELVRETLRKDAADILAGRWVAFGQVDLQVEDPPRWHKDYLTGTDLATRKPAFKLNHRLEGDADIKLIWEPSRWYQLVRLAQAAYVLEDRGYAGACLRWLKDWVQENPPYLGWNWTSALETGLRLVQFVWIDALLEAGRPGDRDHSSALAGLRGAILPPHLWFTWRHRSFGSSANNHLLGELAGLILALVRWPGLSGWATSLDALQAMWESEVQRQFASDGGNLEQALSYHLFSWEFCWQTRLALLAAGRKISGAVEDRLAAGGAFYSGTRVAGDQWDFGDSDGAYVTPFFGDWRRAPMEWQRWLERPAKGSAIEYWIGDPPKIAPGSACVAGARGWRVYPESGQAIWQDDCWFLRWDLSPLGFLSTASHGHCDALHLSIWFKGKPVVIDPGTGAYYSDKALRNHLASWAAHNGPHPDGTDCPRRTGAFLWMNHHERPSWRKISEKTMAAELRLDVGVVRRAITRLDERGGWQIGDSFLPNDGAAGEFEVFWQFAPGLGIDRISNGVFSIPVEDATLTARFDARWQSIEHRVGEPGHSKQPQQDLRGVCSPGFRKTDLSPWISLRARGAVDQEFQTIIEIAPEQVRARCQ